MPHKDMAASLRAASCIVGLLTLPGCVALPVAGPSATEIVRAQRKLGGVDLVDIDQKAIAEIDAAGESGSGRLAALADDGKVDTIGPGDVVQITVYEVGAPLFAAHVTGDFVTGSGSGVTLPPLTVGGDGRIGLPWLPPVVAAGKTTDQLAAELGAAYRRKSEDPQVMVVLRENVANTVVVQGDVRKPGRMPLTPARERLLDAIAIAGGTVNPMLDSIVRVSRRGRLREAPLSAIEPGSDDDLRLLPQDRISVTFRPRTFTVLGATGKVSEVPFQAPRVSLAEAIGRSGGPSDERADPAAVFVFRFDPAGYDGSPAPNARAVAYRFNLRQPNGYFLAQRFAMRPRDVIYVATARATIPTKAIQLLSVFFAPIYTAKVLSQ